MLGYQLFCSLFPHTDMVLKAISLPWGRDLVRAGAGTLAVQSSLTYDPVPSSKREQMTGILLVL